MEQNDVQVIVTEKKGLIAKAKDGIKTVWNKKPVRIAAKCVGGVVLTAGGWILRGVAERFVAESEHPEDDEPVETEFTEE